MAALMVFSLIIALTSGAKCSIHLSTLEGESFELSTIVREYLTNIDGTAIFRYETNEKYSARQHRGKVEFKSYAKSQLNQDKAPHLKSGTYFTDSKIDVTLFHDTGNTGKCMISSELDLYRNIGLEFLPKFNKVADDYIIGPGQLLFLIAQRRDALQFRKLISLRNIPVYMYELELIGKDGKHAPMFVSFSNKSTDELPVEISYTYDNSRTISIQFFLIKRLQMDMSTLTLHRKFEGNLVALDDFVLSPISTCSPAIESKQENLFSGESSIRFSFIAETRHQFFTNTATDSSLTASAPRYSKTFVAYDQMLQSMRVDTLESDSDVKGSQQLFNFKLARMYHILEDGRNILELGTSDSQLSSDNPYKSGQCIAAVMPVKNDNSQPIKWSLGQLLTGTDRFVYMGRAQVRGIPALVYEAPRTKLPFWLEPPVAYRDVDSKAKTRFAEANANNADGRSHLTSLFYFAHNSSNHPLLAIEIFNVCSEYQKCVYDKRTIELFGFQWNLDLAPNGDKTAELFSLKDSCSTSSSVGEHGHVDLILQHSGPLPSHTLSWFNSAPLRNQAVLGGLQESLELSVTLVYDLETKILKEPPNAMSQKTAQHLYVTFRNANHIKQLPELIYLGRGCVSSQEKSGPKRNNLRTFRVHSFHSCFMVAAHRRTDIYFAYDQKSKSCLLDEVPVNHLSSIWTTKEKPNDFVLIDQCHLEIYRIHAAFHHTDSGAWTKDDAYFPNKFRWLDKKVDLYYDEPQDERVVFTIKRIHFHESPRHVDGTTLGTASPIRAIRGYGLTVAPLDTINQLVGPFKLDSRFLNQISNDTGPEQVLEMTPEHCHARCLADLDCQSYSLCLKNYKFECIISRLNFRGTEISQQLNETASIRTTRVKIKLDNGLSRREVELVRGRNCAIHNKSYLDFFIQFSGRVKTMFNGHTIEPVSGREECASICARQSIKSLQLQANRSSDLFKQFFNDSENTGESFKDIREFRKFINKRTCASFMYLEASEVDNFNDDARNKFMAMVQGNVSDRTQFDGYCVIDKKWLDANDGTRNEYMQEERSEWYEPESFGFRANMFFEESHGVGLRRSPKTPLEAAAYKAIQTGTANVTTKDLTIMKEFVLRGENSQIGTIGDKSSCARLCFSQTLNPWPTCRSFDISIERGENIVICRLNSITMSQAIRERHFDLIDYGTEKQIWHYDPRPGFMFDSSTESIDMLMADVDHDTSLGQPIKLTLVILSALVAGVLLSLVLYAKRVSTNRRDIPRRDTMSSVAPLEDHLGGVELDGAIQVSQ